MNLLGLGLGGGGDKRPLFVFFVVGKVPLVGGWGGGGGLGQKVLFRTC